MGCNNAIISNSLFDGNIPLVSGQVAVKEFTPQTPGKYQFSCSMGMIKGTIEVEAAGSAASAASSASDSPVSPSGAKGCGCGGGSGA
jgi:plastocyanin domain-containing protein